MLHGLRGWFSKVIRSGNPFWVILGIHHRARIWNPDIIWAPELPDLHFDFQLEVAVSAFVAGTTQYYLQQSNNYAVPLVGGLQGHSSLLVWLECLIFWALLYLYFTSILIKWLSYSVHSDVAFRLIVYFATVPILCFKITTFSLLGYYNGIRAWSLDQLVDTSSFQSKEEANIRDLSWRRIAVFPLFSLDLCKISLRRSIKWREKGKWRI